MEWIIWYKFISTAIQLKSLLLTTWELVLLRFCLSVSWINLRCFNPLQCWDRAKRTINYASNIPIERVLSLPVHTHSASVLPVLEFPRASYCLSIVFKCRFRTQHPQKKFLVHRRNRGPSMVLKDSLNQIIDCEYSKLEQKLMYWPCEMVKQATLQLKESSCCQLSWRTYSFRVSNCFHSNPHFNQI